MPNIPAKYQSGSRRKGKSTNRVDDVIITRQLMVETHVTQVVLADEAVTTDIDAKEHAVLATTAGNCQLLQLYHHLVDEMIQLTIAARIQPVSYLDYLESRHQNFKTPSLTTREYHYRIDTGRTLKN